MGSSAHNVCRVREVVTPRHVFYFIFFRGIFGVGRELGDVVALVANLPACGVGGRRLLTTF